ncbi:MAG: hypothetical protein K0U34_07455 [Alphaproteobacteria bacterium]|nr:hypothetical protein [Alphaproteobacteria bacterium]
MAVDDPHLPQQVPIEAYGDGGFRFAGMRHAGSLLSLPSGLYGWRPTNLDDVTVEDLASLIGQRDIIPFVLFGVGETLKPLPAPLLEALKDKGIAAEPMDTGAACRTHNVLLAEQRAVAAALLQIP